MNQSDKGEVAPVSPPQPETFEHGECVHGKIPSDICETCSSTDPGMLPPGEDFTGYSVHSNESGWLISLADFMADWIRRYGKREVAPVSPEPKKYWCCVPSKETNGHEHTIHCQNSGSSKKWSYFNNFWGELPAELVETKAGPSQILSNRKSGKTAELMARTHDFVVNNPGKTAMIIRADETVSVSYNPPTSLPEPAAPVSPPQCSAGMSPEPPHCQSLSAPKEPVSARTDWIKQCVRELWPDNSESFPQYNLPGSVEALKVFNERRWAEMEAIISKWAAQSLSAQTPPEYAASQKYIDQLRFERDLLQHEVERLSAQTPPAKEEV